MRRSQACAIRRQRTGILRVRCESGLSCEDSEAKTEDDGREGEDESARRRRSRAQRRPSRRASCSRGAARAAMRVVLLELDGTRAEQGDDLGRFKLADAGKRGIGEHCSGRGDCDTASGVGRWLSHACAMVRWFWARLGMSECANRWVFKSRSSQSQSQSQSQSRGSGKGSDRD